MEQSRVTGKAVRRSRSRKNEPVGCAGKTRDTGWLCGDYELISRSARAYHPHAQSSELKNSAMRVYTSWKAK